jgi:hypothetical protein
MRTRRRLAPDARKSVCRHTAANQNMLSRRSGCRSVRQTTTSFAIGLIVPVAPCESHVRKNAMPQARKRTIFLVPYAQLEARSSPNPLNQSASAVFVRVSRNKRSTDGMRISQARTQNVRSSIIPVFAGFPAAAVTGDWMWRRIRGHWHKTC